MAYTPIIARIESLPPLPESVMELERLYAQGAPEVSELVKVIESDPALTADMLAKVNAPLYSFSRQIVSILQAVTLFGSTHIRAMVLSSAMERSFDIDMTPYGLTTADFARVSKMQSDFIFQWYMGRDVESAKIMTPIAFLMETGKILIANDMLQQKKETKFLTDLHRFEDISSVENIHVTMTSAQINALIFEHWKLNSLFVDTMRYLDGEYAIPSELEEHVTSLQITRKIINVKSQFRESSILEALDIVHRMRFDEALFLKIVERIEDKYKQ